MTMNVFDLFADLAAEASRPELAWMDSAACASVGGDAWYPEQSSPAAPAKRICLTCPVRAECLEYALERNEIYGIWGATSERDRLRIRRARRQAAA